MLNKKIMIMVIVGMLLLSLNVSADEGFGVELLSNKGYVNYIIEDSGYTNGNPYQIKSELEFPLDYEIAKIDFEKNIDVYKFSKIYLSFSKNITDTDSKFKDSDWLNKDPETEPNIYGETNTEVNHSDFNIKGETYKNGGFAFGLGLNYWKNDYVMSGGYQKDEIYNNHTTFDDDLEVLEYEIEVTKPYLYMQYDKEINNNYSFLLNGEFSPHAMVKDYDNHILRGKISEGETSGYAVGLGFEVNRKINNTLSLDLGYKYNWLLARGTQTQTFADGNVGTIDQEHNLKSQSFKIALNYKF